MLTSKVKVIREKAYDLATEHESDFLKLLICGPQSDCDLQLFQNAVAMLLGECEYRKHENDTQCPANPREMAEALGIDLNDFRKEQAESGMADLLRELTSGDNPHDDDDDAPWDDETDD
jgi:hypothetical protein